MKINGLKYAPGDHDVIFSRYMATPEVVAIHVVDADTSEPIAVLTTNVPDNKPSENCVWVKNYEMGKNWQVCLDRCGIATPTDHMCELDYGTHKVTFSEMKLTPDALLELARCDAERMSRCDEDSRA